MGSQTGLEFKQAVEKRRIARFAKAKTLVGKELLASQGVIKRAAELSARIRRK